MTMTFNHRQKQYPTREVRRVGTSGGSGILAGSWWVVIWKVVTWANIRV